MDYSNSLKNVKREKKKKENIWNNLFALDFFLRRRGVEFLLLFLLEKIQ